MKHVFICVCVAAVVNLSDLAWAAEEPLLLDVWPGKAVGDHGDIRQERVRKPEEAPTKDAKWITNVTRPAISVFRPEVGKNTGVAIVVCPGGGYWNLAWDKEGEEVAQWLNTIGVTGVVLKYRVPRRPGEPERLPAPGALLDAQRTVSLVRSQAEKWSVDPNRIGIMGFSAGGHLALATATSFEKRSYEPFDVVDQASCKPNFAVVAYPGYMLVRPKANVLTETNVLAEYIRIPQGTEPMFLVHATDDDEPGAPPEQSVALYLALRQAAVPVELHIYSVGRHGFGVRKTDLPVSKWTDRCAEWMRQQRILPQSPGSSSDGPGAPK